MGGEISWIFVYEQQSDWNYSDMAKHAYSVWNWQSAIYSGRYSPAYFVDLAHVLQWNVCCLSVVYSFLDTFLRGGLFVFPIFFHIFVIKYFYVQNRIIYLFFGNFFIWFTRKKCERRIIAIFDFPFQFPCQAMFVNLVFLSKIPSIDQTRGFWKVEYFKKKLKDEVVFFCG